MMIAYTWATTWFHGSSFPRSILSEIRTFHVSLQSHVTYTSIDGSTIPLIEPTDQHTLVEKRASVLVVPTGVFLVVGWVSGWLGTMFFHVMEECRCCCCNSRTRGGDDEFSARYHPWRHPQKSGRLFHLDQSMIGSQGGWIPLILNITITTTR